MAKHTSLRKGQLQISSNYFRQPRCLQQAYTRQAELVSSFQCSGVDRLFILYHFLVECIVWSSYLPESVYFDCVCLNRESWNYCKDKGANQIVARNR